jgi:hypothetical protein
MISRHLALTRGIDTTRLSVSGPLCETRRQADRRSRWMQSRAAQQLVRSGPLRSLLRQVQQSAK